jgi:hypothetical protein
MKPWLLIVPALLTGTAFADSVCRPEQEAVIDSETRCFGQGGISINFTGETGIKTACMSDSRVRAACGADGQGTRQQAFGQWLNRLKEFEQQCAANGGEFSFKDPQFTEPTDQSYCLQAQPEIGESMFEEPLCNYRSICPAVTVVCLPACGDKVAHLPGQADRLNTVTLKPVTAAPNQTY